LMTPFAESSRSSLVLALRSSTRALPMAVLGLALGTGALVSAPARRISRQQWVVGAAVTALAAVNLPAAWNGGFVDPVLERDQDPPDGGPGAPPQLDALPGGFR